MYAHGSLCVPHLNVACVWCVCEWRSFWGGFLDMWLGGPSIFTANTWPGRICLFGLVPLDSCSILCMRVSLASAAQPYGVCLRLCPYMCTYMCPYMCLYMCVPELVLMPYVLVRWCRWP